MRKERILLSFVETVDFIHEQERAASVDVSLMLGLLHDRFDLFDAGNDGAEGDEVRFTTMRDDASEGGLAGARGTPQNQRADGVFFDRGRERCVRTGDLLLADELVEIARPHALRERARLVDGRFRSRGSREEISLVHAQSICALALASSRLVEYERGGGGDVERLHLALHGDAHVRVAARQHLVVDPRAFTAENDGAR